GPARRSGRHGGDLPRDVPVTVRLRHMDGHRPRARDRAGAIELTAGLGLDVTRTGDRDARGLELRVQLRLELRLEAPDVQRLAAREGGEGNGEQDGGASREP